MRKLVLRLGNFEHLPHLCGHGPVHSTLLLEIVTYDATGIALKPSSICSQVSKWWHLESLVSFSHSTLLISVPSKFYSSPFCRAVWSWEVASIEFVKFLEPQNPNRPVNTLVDPLWVGILPVEYCTCFPVLPKPITPH